MFFNHCSYKSTSAILSTTAEIRAALVESVLTLIGCSPRYCMQLLHSFARLYLYRSPYCICIVLLRLGPNNLARLPRPPFPSLRAAQL